MRGKSFVVPFDPLVVEEYAVPRVWARSTSAVPPQKAGWPQGYSQTVARWGAPGRRLPTDDCCPDLFHQWIIFTP